MRSKGIPLAIIRLSFLVFGIAPFPVYAQGHSIEYCDGDPTLLKTAIGCINTNPQEFLSWLLPVMIGIASGTAFLIILLGSFQIQISTGNPERIHAGREMISSAVAGLLLIIFSVFILRLIGVDVLGIPEFG